MPVDGLPQVGDRLVDCETGDEMIRRVEELVANGSPATIPASTRSRPCPTRSTSVRATTAPATGRVVESIVAGLRWRAVNDPVPLKGTWQDAFVDRCEELGMLMTAGLEAGVF